MTVHQLAHYSYDMVDVQLGKNGHTNSNITKKRALVRSDGAYSILPRKRRIGKMISETVLTLPRIHQEEDTP
jgi:hypothetical protein